MTKLKFWLPPILWMAVIYLASGRESIEVSGTYLINFIFFKTLHLFEYALLYLLSWRAIRNTFVSRNNHLFVLAAFLLTVVYAISDELHQSFVPTRESRVRDVIIDAAGAATAWILHAKLLPKAPEKLKKWARRLAII